MTPDITATLIFHREAALAIPAMDSFQLMVEAARTHGLAVQIQAMLDRPDAATRHIVGTCSDRFDRVEEVDFGDLGLTRNAGVQRADGRFLAFFDGDDLWGSDWLHAAHASAVAADRPDDTVWHPAWLYYFAESDFDRHVTGITPHPEAKSFIASQPASTDPDFDRRLFAVDNLWTANAFASRALHARFPYSAVDQACGFGIEDWSWNIATVMAGIQHLTVPETVHLIRQKDTGSLGTRNAAEGLMPRLPPGLFWPSDQAPGDQDRV